MPPQSDPEQPTVTDNKTQAGFNPARPASYTDNLIGTMLGGRYLVERELARGGMGVVYLARDKPELLSRPVVVKLLLEEAMKSEWVMTKFRQEIEALTRLDDPGAVGIFDAGELPDQTPYFVMQYVEGVNLRSALKPEGMSLERVAAILKQVGRTISKAHDKGILHRDLKPENIMLREAGGEEQVKVIDFGIARIKNSVLAPSTGTGILAGTIAYMSPEQLSARPLTNASDIYALGVIAYEMLTGRRPFNPASDYQLLEMQRAGIRVRPADLRPGLPQAAEDAVLRALAFDAKDRYQRAHDFTDELAHALADQAGATDEANKPTLVDDDNQRRGKEPFSWMPIAIAVVFAALIGGGMTLWSPWKDSNANPAQESAGTTPIGTGRAKAGPGQRALSYWVEVQKYLDGKPYKTPMRQPGEITYQVGDRVRFFFRSPQAGHLYVINQGPNETGGHPDFNLLFPTPTANNASSALTANQQVQVPGSWFKIDDERGTERLWLVWSVEAIRDFENIARAVVTPEARGVISESGQIKTVQDFIAQYSAMKTEVVKDEDQKLTNIQGGTDVLVSLLKLEHY